MIFNSLLGLDDIEADENIYGLEHTSVNILCKHKAITDYCWFRNPAGHKISLSDRKRPRSNDTYRFVEENKVIKLNIFIRAKCKYLISNKLDTMEPV